MEAHLGPYQIVRALGRGGVAEVLLALKLGAGGFRRRVVVKCLHDHLCGDPHAENRFVEEAILGSHLDHSLIVKVLDLGVSGGRLYMVMEYVDGLDLRTLLAHGGPLPPELVLYIGHQVARALHYAHTLSDDHAQPLEIVHRDVSPSNILLSRTGEVKLADFGVAKAVGREATRSGIIKGKYAYMSPEQVSLAPVQPQSDLFSLGSVLYEAATGARLFHGNGPLEILERVRTATRAPVPDALVTRAPRLSAILEQALERNWNRRCESARSMSLAMERAMAMTEMNAPPFETLATRVEHVLETIASSKSPGQPYDSDSATLRRDLRKVGHDDDVATSDYLVSASPDELDGLVIEIFDEEALMDVDPDSTSDITGSYNIRKARKQLE